MGMDFAPPKYAQVVQAIQERIESGEYAPGQLLPSESQLVREFGVGRTTVVRALQMLAMQGWIEREHGRGSFVKGRPASTTERSRPGLFAAELAEHTDGLVEVKRIAAPGHVARLLGLDERTPVIVRQRITRHDGQPSSLETLWFPLEIALGTDLDQAKPLPRGVRHHLQAVKHLRFDHVAERISSRLPGKDEAQLLGLSSKSPILSVLATVFDASGAALLVLDVVMPGDLHELEDVYPVG